MDNRHAKTEKLTDKAFSRSLLALVLGILLCMTCLCSATWAWFSASSAAEGNELSAGKFDLAVSVAREGVAPVSLTEQAAGKAVYTFSEVGVYTVELTITPDTTVSKGFCVLSVGGAVYYTAAIEAPVTSLSFTVDVRVANTTATFSPSWGYPSATELVEEGEPLVIQAP